MKRIRYSEAGATAAVVLAFAIAAGCSAAGGQAGQDHANGTSGSGADTGTSGAGSGSSAGGQAGSAAAETSGGTSGATGGGAAPGESCSLNATQGCWPGDPASRGRGICRDGTQTCVASGQLGAWGPCEGAVLPTQEVDGDCIDDDCDGDAPGCGNPCAMTETCGNGVDDDCDGVQDCADPICECDDVPCLEPNDCLCEECPPGSERWCDAPVTCAWGKQLCAPDGSWGACIEVPPPPQCNVPPPFWPFPFPPPPPNYDPQCCVTNGFCCQNWGLDPSKPSDASIGNCPGMVPVPCPPGTPVPPVPEVPRVDAGEAGAPPPS